VKGADHFGLKVSSWVRPVEQPNVAIGGEPRDTCFRIDAYRFFESDVQALFYPLLNVIERQDLGFLEPDLEHDAIGVFRAQEGKLGKEALFLRER